MLSDQQKLDEQQAGFLMAENVVTPDQLREMQIPGTQTGPVLGHHANGVFAVILIRTSDCWNPTRR